MAYKYEDRDILSMRSMLVQLLYQLVKQPVSRLSMAQQKKGQEWCG